MVVLARHPVEVDPRTVRFLEEMEREHGRAIADVCRRFILGEIELNQRPTRHVKRGWTVGERPPPIQREKRNP